MAEVFRAVDLGDGPDVAVKVAVGRSTKHAGRIADEARTLAALKHPSIVGFISHGTMPGGSALAGRPFLVEELVLGPSLSHAFNDGGHNAGKVAVWARGFFHALAHLHGQGLVHRDIKPANLMLSGLRRSPVRIIDFGIAAVAGTAGQPGISSGTVHYMSPEQASGGPVRPSWDVYAMGLVLLELLTGTKAFPGTAIESLVARTLRDPEIPEFLGPGWADFLASLTAMDPARRPDAAEAAATVDGLVPQEPACPMPTPCRRTVLPSRRILQSA